MMWFYYSKMAWVQLKKYPFFSGLTILGLTLGMSATFLIYLWIQDEYAYEEFHHHANEIYRVLHLKNENGQIVKTDRSVMPLAAALREKFPQVINATFIKYESIYPIRYGEELIEEQVNYVDVHFFSVFSFPVVDGDPVRTMQSPDGVVLTDVVARKLFGNESAVGKTIIIRPGDWEATCIVGAVIHVPEQSHIALSVTQSIMWYENTPAGHLVSDWKRGEATVVYIQTVENPLFDKQTIKEMNDYLETHVKNPDKLLFQPLKDIHLYSDFLSYTDRNRGNYKNIFIFSGLALLILGMGAFNFIILTTALYSQRGKEVAIRKAYGSSICSLIRCFFSETLLQSGIAMVLALGVIYLIIPVFIQITGKQLSIAFSTSTVCALLLIGLLITLLAGAYPVLFLSTLNPVMAFRGGNRKGLKSSMVKQLLLVQFVISVILLVIAMSVQKQLHYIKTVDLGLDKKGIITIHTGLWYGVDAFKKEVLKNPNIENITMGSTIDDCSWHRNFKWVSSCNAIDSAQMNILWVDGSFAQVYGLQLITGEFLQGDFDAYWRDTPRQVVINEAAAKKIGLGNPVGITITDEYFKYTICGVAKNFHFRPLHEPIAPLVITYYPESMTYVHIRIRPENQVQTLTFLKKVYEKMRPNRVFEYEFFENTLANNYRAEQRQGRLFMFFTLLSIFISILGVLGLVAFSTQQRVKEISIRKVNGATAKDIIVLFMTEYLIWVGIAIVVAIPVGWYFMHQWLQNFAYHTSLNWWIFALAGIIAVLIVMLTIGFQTLRASTVNPMKGLRTE